MSGPARRPIGIEGLGEKLRLLAQLGGLGGWPGLAARFGRKPKTLRYWANGNDARAPDMLPAEHLPVLQTLIAEALGDRATPRQVDDVLRGPPLAFEHALLGRSGLTLSELIETLGQAGEMQLVTGRGTLELVQVHAPGRKRPAQRVKLGGPFRLILAGVPRRPVILVLQKSPAAWGFLGSGTRETDGALHIPGHIGAVPATMTERAEPGEHRFIVLALAKPPAIPLSRYAREGLPLDLPALASLAETLQQSSAGQRSILYADLVVE